jgi:hypothetical protein
MTQHTPGPWRTHLTDDTLVIDAVGVPVATMDGNYVDGSHANMEANARIIAAAPDLLEALIVTRQHLRLFCTDADSIAAAVFELADSAIAKAKGEA